ncbi:MAG TPA: hypothetical protein VEU62_24195 [Bryobacterales bacterium]|nr:hypothetical protein [Bryobacterales bacterium]
MKRKLVALDLALLVAIGTVSWRLRENWVAARAREQKLYRDTRQAVQSPGVSVPAAPQPVTATGYADIAQKMLFSKDRNPTVVIEPAPAPPPKPMPPLPVLYGVMNLVDGPTVIMSERADTAHQGVRTGDKVGEFTLVAVSRDEITLEWDGKDITKQIDEMIDRSAKEPAQPPPGTPRGQQTAVTTVAQQQPVERRADPVPGVDVGKGMRSCLPGDTSPAGTVSNGYRKVVRATPFGDQCHWEQL